MNVDHDHRDTNERVRPGEIYPKCKQTKYTDQRGRDYAETNEVFRAVVHMSRAHTPIVNVMSLVCSSTRG